MSYFVGTVEYTDGSGVTWRYYHTLPEAEQAVKRSGGYIVEAYDMKAIKKRPSKSIDQEATK